ncbi:hypothetical protein ACFWHL_16240 [Streptomyces massasporeus]
MSAERERQSLLRATADGIVASLPAWDGESPSVWVVVIDPETRTRLTQRRTSATAAPQPKACVRHLHAVRERAS